MELLDMYDENRCPIGVVRQRGEPWQPGEYGLAVCVWVYDGRGNVLLTRRAPEKTFAGTWENSGGAAQAGEDSLTAIVRELWEETGIQADAGEFEYLCSSKGDNFFFDHYCLHRDVSLDQIKLLPGETDDVMWASFEKVHDLIRQKKICHIIAEQFLQMEKDLLRRQSAQ